jgi:hypothetical protein
MSAEKRKARPSLLEGQRGPVYVPPRPGVLPGLAAWAIVAFAGPMMGAAGAGLAALALALGDELWSGITGRVSLHASPLDTLIMFGYGFFGAYALGFFVSAPAGIYFGLRAGMVRWFSWREAALAGLAIGLAVIGLLVMAVPAHSLQGGADTAFLFLAGALSAALLCRQLMIAFGILVRPPPDEDEDSAP